MLSELLRKRRVPYDSVFDQILSDKGKKYFIAFSHEGIVASFIVVSFRDESKDGALKKTAVLTLSASAKEYMHLSPNYLLIWEAICTLTDMGLNEFNLGLLTYQKSPDPDLEGVAFFKKKWITHIETMQEYVSLPKYLYIRYLKQFKTIKNFIYIIQSFNKSHSR